MAGLRPGHPRLPYLSAAKTWMPGIADKFTQSALPWPGMTSFASEADFIGCFLSQTLRSARSCARLEGWATGHMVRDARLRGLLTMRGLSKRIPLARTMEFIETAQVICPSGGLLTGLSSLISDFPKNISVPTHPKSHLEFFASHPTRGAYHDRHGRGEGCGGRGSVRRATWWQGGLAKGP